MRRYAVTRRWVQWSLAAFDAVGGRWRGRLRQPPGAVRRLLFIRRERFGDLITMLPALARARSLFPQARITWMVAPAYAPFAAGLGVVDEVWSVASWWRGVRERPRGFDLALEFHADARWIMVARRHARRVAGYGIRGGGFGLDHEAEFPWARHAVERNVYLVEQAAGAAGAPVPMPRMNWWEASTPENGGAVLVHPGCGQVSKRWAEASWRELITLCQDAGHAVFLAGGPAERALCRRLATATGARHLAGGESWSGLAERVRAAGAVVAPDTGVIHLAQALGTPAVALFGPTDPVVWGYAGEQQAVAVHRLACSHCDRKRCPRVGRGQISPCMQAITPAEVAAAVGVVMGRRPAPARPPLAARAGRGHGS